MNRIIKVSRINDPQAPTGISVRIEAFNTKDPGPSTLTLTPDEAIELHAILSYFNPNQWISSVTGSAAPPIIPADPRKGGAS